MTLACEDGNSKLVEVVTVADVDAEKRVDNSLVQIWRLKLGHKAEFLFRLWAQGLVKILKLKFRRDFKAEAWPVFCCWCFVKVTKLNLGQDSEVRFGQDFKFKFSRDADVWLRFCSWCLIKILKLKFDQDLCKKLWYEFNPWVRSAFGDVFADHLIANISFRQIVKETSQFRRQFQSYSACCSKSDCWKNLAPIWIIWTFSPPV